MTKRRIMRTFKIAEISAVDKPAQAGARVVIMKRDDGPLEDEALPVVTKRLLLTTSVSGHSHLIDDAEQGGTTSYQTAEGDEYGHDHPYVVNAAGVLEIGESNGHTHSLSDDSFSFQSKRANDNTLNPPNVAKGDDATEEDTVMDKELQKKLDELQKQLDESTVALTKAQAEATLTDAQKAFYAKLDDTAKVAYLAKSPEDREVEVAKSQDEDAVVYTADDGTAYRKSDDGRLISMAKQGDEDRRIAKEEREKRLDLELAKRASDDLSHLPGDDKVKVALIKAIDGGIKDDETRTAAYELLKAADAGTEKNFKRIGTGQSPEGDGAASEQLNTLAKKHAEENKVSFAKAYDHVLTTDEGERLYQQTVRH